MASLNPFRFSTHYTDQETGLVYAKRRYYTPTTGRWLSKDPIGERGGSNLYGYTQNQPTMLFDPFGLTGWGLFPKPCPCVCKSVTWSFNPGGQQFQLAVIGGNRIGNDIKVVWSVTGNQGGCKVEQNERGFLVFNRVSPAGKKPDGGSVTGKDNVVPNSMKQHGKGTITYTDVLGWSGLSSPDYDGVWEGAISLDVELKCTSEDGTSVSKSFRIEHHQQITFP